MVIPHERRATKSCAKIAMSPMGLRAAGAQCFVARLAEGLDLGCAATPRLRASGGATRLAANCSEVP